MAKRLSVDEIVQRIRIGGPEGQFMSQFMRNDLGMCKKFIDASPTPLFTGSDVDLGGTTPADIPVEMPKGQTTGLTADVLIKVAAVAINDPDYHIVAKKQQQGQDGQVSLANDNYCAQVARQFLKDEQDKKNWGRIQKKVLMKRYVAGMGCAAYSWAEGGVKWEHIQSWDLAVDPFVIDWQNLDWGAKRIRLSVRKAAERYPNADFAKRLKSATNASADQEKIDIWIYWDKDQEAHIYESKLLNTKEDDRVNRYGVVPFLFLEGDIHPGRSPFPLGDMVLAAGPEAEVSDLVQLISSTAKNGLPINFYDPQGMDKGAQDKLQQGDPQGWIAIKGLEALTRPPVYRLEAEQLSSAIMEALRRAENYRDGIVGIGEYDRGVAENSPKFATEVYAAMSRGGARKNQAQAEFEGFMDRWARITIALTKELGGPHEHNGATVSTPEQEELWEALQAVTEVHVLEGSTIYRDPSADQQQSMQLAQMTSQAYPLMLNLSQIGVMKQLPDMQKIWDRVFRSFGVNETDQYWIPAPQMPQQHDGKPPMEMISYKDAPEDIKRQMEQQAGMQPSQIGTPPDSNTNPSQDMLAHMNPMLDLEKQKRDHQFQLHSQVMKQIHEIGLKNADMENQRQIASEQRKAMAIAGRSNGTAKK